LEIGRGGAAGGVDTDGRHVITLTDLKDTLLCVVGCVVCAPETVIDVLAEGLLVLAGRVADFHAKAISTHEAEREMRHVDKRQDRKKTHFVQSITCWYDALLPPLLGNALEYMRPPRGLPRYKSR
jgi:hypothetical protein